MQDHFGTAAMDAACGTLARTALPSMACPEWGCITDDSILKLDARKGLQGFHSASRRTVNDLQGVEVDKLVVGERPPHAGGRHGVSRPAWPAAGTASAFDAKFGFGAKFGKDASARGSASRNAMKSRMTSSLLLLTWATTLQSVKPSRRVWATKHQKSR